MPKGIPINNKPFFNLRIDEDQDLYGKPVATMLFTPSMDNPFPHYHIELEVEEILKLSDWLNKFVEEHKLK